MLAFEENDTGVFRRVAAVAGHHSVQNASRGEPKHEMASVLVGAGYDGRVVAALMFVVKGGPVAAPGGGQGVFPGGKMFKSKRSLGVGMRRLHHLAVFFSE